MSAPSEVRPHALLSTGVALTVIGVAFGIAGLITSTAVRAAEPQRAESTLVELSITEIPPIPVDAFAGLYGTATTPDTTQTSDEDLGDFSDPDETLTYVTVNGTEVVETSWDSASGQLTARANATSFELDYNEVNDFLTAGSVDAYARCIDRGDALAYARSDGSQAEVLGRGVANGVPTLITVTGDELNMPSVSVANLTVLEQTVENVVNEPGQISAEAYLHYTITAELYDDNGDLIYSGSMVDMKLGHVVVECLPSVPPTTASPTGQDVTGTPSDDPTGPTGDPTDDVPTEDPTTGEPTREPSASMSQPGLPPGSTAHSGTNLPATGGSVGPLLAIGILVTGIGTTLIWFSRRDVPKH